MKRNAKQTSQAKPKQGDEKAASDEIAGLRKQLERAAKIA